MFAETINHSCLIQDDGDLNWSLIKSPYQYQLAYFLHIHLYTLNPSPLSAMDNKGAEFLGCWFMSIREHDTPHASFSMCLSLLYSLILYGPFRSNSKLCRS